MKIRSRIFKGLLWALIILTLSTAQTAMGQRRQQSRPSRPATQPGTSTSTTSPETSETSAAKRTVTVNLKEGAPVTGEYQSANTNTLFLIVAGNRISIKLDDVTAIYFGNAPAAAALTPQPTAPQTGILALEAGIIYKMGGNQPVARTEFMLLDKSLEAILIEAGMDAGRTGVLSNYAFAVKYPSQFPGVAQRVREAIQPHVIQSVSTDFSGKAQFTEIKPGNYYLYGLTSTRGGFAIWNTPVEVKPGQNTIFLDQNNAATAF